MFTSNLIATFVTDVLPFLGGLSGVGAFGLALAVLLKIGVDKTDIKIGTADKVMIGQDRFINELKESLNEQTLRVDRLSAQVDALRQELNDVTYERDKLRSENRKLLQRVTDLEQRVGDLTAQGKRASGSR